MRSTHRNYVIIATALVVKLLVCMSLLARDVIRGNRRSLESFEQAYVKTSGEECSIPPKTILETMSIERLQEIYQRYISSQQVMCRYNARMSYNLNRNERPNVFGKNEEICVEEPYKPRKPCLAYSFSRITNLGSNLVKRYGCEVYVFGNRNEKSKDSGIHYVNTKDEVKNLKQIMKSNDHSKKEIDILKIDNIPQSSWDIVATFLQDESLKPVKQILVTFLLSKESQVEEFLSKLGILRELYQQGFRFCHMHQSKRDTIMEHNKKKFYQENVVTLLNINYL